MTANTLDKNRFMNFITDKSIKITNTAQLLKHYIFEGDDENVKQGLDEIIETCSVIVNAIEEYERNELE